jgi:hypothetical protein
MLELANETSLRAGLYPGYGRDRGFQLTCVVKATYAIDANGRLTAKAAAPIEEVDRHAGDPVKSALIAAGETVPYKDGAEFYLYGSVQPATPDLRAMEVAVSLAARDGHTIRKALRIFGKRSWSGLGLFPRVGEPQPLTALSLSYEHAYGGLDPFPRAGERDPYPGNWIGKGYLKDTKKCIGLELPQIEYADKPIKSPEDRPPTAGFGPLPAFWSPRLEAQGRLDATKTSSVGCTRAEDAAPSLYHCAPLDQRLPKPFIGGETVTLTSLIPGNAYGKAVTITLPALAPALILAVGREQQILKAVCDTLIIDTDKKELSLIGRVGIPWKLTERRRGWVFVRDASAQAASQPVPVVMEAVS